MSRCFPYPPPGYFVKIAGSEALIDSIKLQRETEKAKAERKKERKREAKEKRRERKGSEKHNDRVFGHGEKRKRTEDKVHNWEKVSKGDLKGGATLMKDDSELLERSNITEEHEQPLFSQNPCSSDSSEDSNKKRRHAPLESGIRAQGNVLRIRLPTQKHKERDALVSKEQPSSTFARTNLTGQQGYAIAHGPSQEELCSASMRTDVCQQAIAPRPDNEPSSSTSGRTGIIDLVQTAYMPTSLDNKIQLVGSLYRGLVENWIPPLLQSNQFDMNDQAWLFERKGQEGHRCRSSSDALSSGSITSWPQAKYLPEADVCALPFTVPF